MSEIVRFPTAELNPADAAVNATVRGPVEVLSKTPVTGNVALAWPARIVTLDGNVTAAASDALKLTVRLVAVEVLRVTVPTVLLPLAIDEAANDSTSDAPCVSSTVRNALD